VINRENDKSEEIGEKDQKWVKSYLKITKIVKIIAKSTKMNKIMIKIIKIYIY
jgi:hypothetical protein